MGWGEETIARLPSGAGSRQRDLRLVPEGPKGQGPLVSAKRELAEGLANQPAESD